MSQMQQLKSKDHLFDVNEPFQRDEILLNTLSFICQRYYVGKRGFSCMHHGRLMDEERLFSTEYSTRKNFPTSAADWCP